MSWDYRDYRRASKEEEEGETLQLYLMKPARPALRESGQPIQRKALSRTQKMKVPPPHTVP